MTFYSSLTSLLYFKGFSLMRTQHVEESAQFICQMAYKVGKGFDEGKRGFHSGVEPGQTPSTEELGVEPGQTQQHYSSLVKSVKKDNITPQNIGEIMLKQIPGISDVTAVEIMKEYKSMKNLIECLERDPKCMENLKAGKRKVSKRVIQNIQDFLLGGGAAVAM
jgi:ERCC4-type nuclease